MSETEAEPMATSAENGEEQEPTSMADGGLDESGGAGGDVSAAGGERKIVDSENTDDRKLFVGGLSWQTQNSDLKDYFKKFGDVVEASIKTDSVTGNSRGFGFVVFAESGAIDAVLEEKNHTINGKAVDPKRAKARERPRKVFVGGLDPNVGEDEVKEYFGKYGDIEECEFPMDKAKNQRRQFAFITFKSADGANRACENPKQTIGPKECDIKLATPKDQAQGGGFRGGRGGGRGFGRGGYFGGRGSSMGGGAGGWGGQSGYGSYGAGGYGSYPGYDYSGYSGYGQGYGYDYGSYPYYGSYGGYSSGAPRGGGAAGAKAVKGYHPYQR